MSYNTIRLSHIHLFSKYVVPVIVIIVGNSLWQTAGTGVCSLRCYGILLISQKTNYSSLNFTSFFLLGSVLCHNLQKACIENKNSSIIGKCNY